MIKYIIQLAAAAFLLFGCDKNRNHPGYDYFPDMFYSDAYESYAPHAALPDGKSLLEPVEGTIPRGGIPYSLEKNDTDIVKARLLKVPVEATFKNIHQGKQLFEVYCQMCHGEKGDGQGHLYTTKKYPYPPKSLINERVRQQPGGEIFHSISVGFGIMGAHKSMIRQDDRWKIVHYIRHELQKEK